MNPSEPRGRAHQVGGCLILLVGLAASVAEILNYLGVKPSDLPIAAKAGGSSVLAARPAEPAAPPEPSPSTNPARMVLVVENFGDMGRVARNASSFASSLQDRDVISLIAFVGSRHVWIFRDEPGDRGREEVVRRARTLFSTARPPSRKAAVEDALGHLGRASGTGPNPAVVVLTAAADEAAIGRALAAARSGARPEPRVLLADGGAPAPSR